MNFNMSIKENLETIQSSIPADVTLVAVTKTKPVEIIQEAYDAGHRIFGENKVQEMAAKYELLPKDIEWHMIGHLQRNKVKYMASFVNMIHGVDSLKLLIEIDKQAKKHDRIINCLLQVKIADEDSKFGISTQDAETILKDEIVSELNHIKVIGLMGMATFTSDMTQVKSEFIKLKTLFDELQSIKRDNIELSVLSMGMSGDYSIAINCGSTMVRIGSSIFGARNY